jgi:hypothetical protein
MSWNEYYECEKCGRYATQEHSTIHGSFREWPTCCGQNMKNLDERPESGEITVVGDDGKC